MAAAARTRSTCSGEALIRAPVSERVVQADPAPLPGQIERAELPDFGAAGVPRHYEQFGGTDGICADDEAVRVKACSIGDLVPVRTQPSVCSQHVSSWCCSPRPLGVGPGNDRTAVRYGLCHRKDGLGLFLGRRRGDSEAGRIVGASGSGDARRPTSIATITALARLWPEPPSRSGRARRPHPAWHSPPTIQPRDR